MVAARMTQRLMAVRMARNMLPSMVVNAALPALLYLVLRTYFPDPSVVPIAAAAMLPVLGNLLSLARTGRLDTFGALMLLGFALTAVTILIGGDPRMILVSRSLLTLGMGVACLASLLWPKTISFYFARQFATGNDRVQAAHFDDHWKMPYVRRVSRLTSAVWGIALVGDFGLRLAMIYSLPAAVVLAVGPIAHNVLSMGAMLWTVWYGVRAMRRLRHSAPEAASTAPTPD
jgi:hypothetical protein